MRHAGPGDRYPRRRWAAFTRALEGGESSALNLLKAHAHGFSITGIKANSMLKNCALKDQLHVPSGSQSLGLCWYTEEDKQTESLSKTLFPLLRPLQRTLPSHPLT